MKPGQATGLRSTTEVPPASVIAQGPRLAGYTLKVPMYIYNIQADAYTAIQKTRIMQEVRQQYDGALLLLNMSIVLFVVCTIFDLAVTIWRKFAIQAALDL